MTLEELKADEAGIVAQMHQLQGALAYVRQKIALLEKEAVKAAKEEGKTNGEARAPVVPTRPDVEVPTVKE